MSARFNPYDLDNVKDILDALERFNFHKAYYECINQLEDEIAELRQALELIAGECENYTSGDCYQAGRIEGHEYSAKSVCYPCIANRALKGGE